MASLEELLGESPTPTPSSTGMEHYEPGRVPVEFVTGPAGSGKTFEQKRRIQENNKYGILCATTGIAAINLGATTLNSTLKFFDTNSLRDVYHRGRLTSRLHALGRGVKRLVIDEVSMMDARQLDYIYNALDEVNDFADMKEPMGIVLTGDFCQLPPVKAPWAFEADCWKHFDHGTTKLTKIWRQDNPQFLEALNAARAGEGKKAVDILQGLGVKFRPQADSKFDGTTILSKNDQVDRYNFAALLDLPGQAYGRKALTWGEQAGEWKNIPEMLKLKDGALVMILANDTSGEFSYANGDLGHIQQADEDGSIWVKLLRNEETVQIFPITRYRSLGEKDAEDAWAKSHPGEKLDAFNLVHLWCDRECGHNEPGLKNGPWGQPSYNCQSGTYNLGAIRYYPLRLAYATTVHKSQGLTLDRCQIDVRDPFFGSPQMAYVALSRCKTPEGLEIVGDPSRLTQQIKLEPKVRRYL